MKMIDYFEAYREKWVSIALVSGQGAYYQGVVKEIGEDYIVIQQTENEMPVLINIRNITAFKPMRMKENGKPKLFG